PDGCPHLSIPVETDESMTLSSLNLAWPACQHCQSHNLDPIETGKEDRFSPILSINDISSLDYPDGYSGLPRDDLRVTRTERPVIKLSLIDSEDTDSPAGLPSLYLPQSARRGPQKVRIEDVSEDFSGLDLQNLPVSYSHRRNPVSENEESLEKPCPLRSDLGENLCRHSQAKQQRCYGQYPPDALNGFQYKHEQPADYSRANCPVYHQFPPRHAKNHPQNRCLPRHVTPLRPPQVTPRQSTAPVRELISEVCINPSQPGSVGQPQALTRTISLPDDCRNVFITYSVDIAAELMPFVSFLINQGFRPAIDIFEDRVRQMDINKWMDSFLKNKSVLIIIVISPKYKVDVEGDGSDQHGLHTKYIHTQIQNEFIQQRCLNFRLVPVLFPSANQSHVPLWLLSTRRYRWPEDAEDLILRLLREEKYIIPPLGKEVTLTIKPL
ncbi:putative adapter protein CIKS, partial [Triplophysa rosa]